MCRKVVARSTLGNKRAQFNILYRHLLLTQTLVKNFSQPPVVVGSRRIERLYGISLLLCKASLQALHHAVERHLGSVGNKRKYRIVEVVSHRLKQVGHHVFTQCLALFIDILVATAREIDPFKRAPPVLTLSKNVVDRNTAVLAHNQSRTRRQFLYIVDPNIQHRLNHRTLRSYHHNLIVVIIESRTYALAVAQGKHIARARHAANHKTAVPQARLVAKDVVHIDIVLNESRKPVSVGSLVAIFTIQPVVLHVERMAELLKDYKRVGIYARMLSLAHHRVENLVNVGHIEVAAQQQVARAPIVAAQERMHIAHPRLTRRAVT